MHKPDKPYKFSFIVNPIAGGRAKYQLPALLRQHLNCAPEYYKILYTKRKKHGYELAKEALKDSEVIVAVGGDGTVHEVANAVFGSNVKMGILPMGSGNGLARDVGIPMKIPNAIRALHTQHTTAIDVGKIGDKIFTNSFSLGKVAKIAHAFDKLPMRGMKGYALCIFKSLFDRYRFDVRLQIDDRPMSCKLALLDVMNISEFGNHLKVAPSASATDGRLHLQIFYKFPWYLVPLWTLKAFLNIPIRSRHFFSTPFHRLEITHKETLVQYDGETEFVNPGKLVVECMSGAIALIVPISASTRE